MVISKVHLSVTVSVFCIVGHLETPNLVVFSNIFISLHPTIKNVTPRRTLPSFIMLHCSGIRTRLPCDYLVSSFLGIFTSYQINPTSRCTILVPRDKLKLHIDKLNLLNLTTTTVKLKMNIIQRNISPACLIIL